MVIYIFRKVPLFQPASNRNTIVLDKEEQISERHRVPSIILPIGGRTTGYNETS